MTLRNAATIIGLAVLGLATLLYESENRKIQDKLVELWTSIEDSEQKRVTFMQTAARLTTAGLNRILGPRLISLQSVGLSLCYSYVSFLILLIYFDRYRSIERSPVFDDLNVLLYLMLGSLPLLNLKPKDFFLKHRNLFLKLWFSLVITSFMVVDLFEYRFLLGSSWSEALDLISQSRLFYLGIVIGIVSDILFVGLLRKLLRYSANSESLPKLLALVVISCVCVVMFFLGPILYEQRVASLDQIYASDWLFTVWIAVTSNLFIAMIGGMFVCIGLGMLVLRALAGFMARAVYRLERLGISGQRKLLTRISLLLIGWGIGGGWLLRIAKILISNL